MEMRTLDECRVLLGPKAEGQSDEQIAKWRDQAYAFANGIYAAYTATREPVHMTLADRRAAKGLPPQRRPLRKKVSA